MTKSQSKEKFRFSQIEFIFPSSVSDQHPIAQAEKQLDPQAEDESSSIDISSLHLNQTKVLGYIKQQY